nr:hypothetical protein [uncultured Campylobacter sp.]
MNGYSLVLENELLLEFEKFKRGLRCDKYIIEGILNYYKPTHLINKVQIEFLEENGITIDDDEKMLLLQSGFANLDLRQLSLQTRYKIILSSTNIDFPSVCIKNDKIQNVYTATFKARESRSKALEHFKALLSNADRILIYDKYINKNGFELFHVKCCHPNLKIVISNEIFPNPSDAHKKAAITTYCNQYQQIQMQPISQYPQNSTHDRYILIEYGDNIFMEIILTSGFEYLNDVSKDFTYIVREI